VAYEIKRFGFDGTIEEGYEYLEIDGRPSLFATAKLESVVVGLELAESIEHDRSSVLRNSGRRPAKLRPLQKPISSGRVGDEGMTGGGTRLRRDDCAGGSWSALGALVRGIRQRLARGALRTLPTDRPLPHRTPSTLERAEAFLEVLARSGFSLAESELAIRTVTTWAYGWLGSELEGRATQSTFPERGPFGPTCQNA
jgi:hypothetical protein